MIFKIMPASASFHGVDYNEKKKDQGAGSLIHFENFGYLQERSQVSRNDVKDFFKQHSARNSRIKKPQFHAILSCKGQELSYEQLKEKAMKLMGSLGYEKQPLLIYQHNDTRNNHVHIVTSRVDSNGRKINDKFEGMRANRILNEMLSINEKQVHQRSIEGILRYKVSTESQFILLLEKQGYVCKRRGEELLLFKYGHEQGSITIEQIQKQLEKGDSLKVQTAELSVIIEKYKQEYPAGLIGQDVSNAPTGKRNFSSHLTDYLHKNHGLEFVFFGTKAHDKPYGYVIIDHNSKVVIKGSEVMKLEHLTSNLPIHQGSLQDQQPGIREQPETGVFSSIKPRREEGSDDLFVHKPNQSFLNEELLQTLDMIIDDALKENENSGIAKKRKKGKKNQSYRP